MTSSGRTPGNPARGAHHLKYDVEVPVGAAAVRRDAVRHPVGDAGRVEMRWKWDGVRWVEV